MALRGWIVRGIVSAAIALTCARPQALACGPSVVDRVRITKADAPADAKLERVRFSLTSRTAGENLAGTSLRVLTVRPRPEDPARFDATLYDDSIERGVQVVLDDAGNELSRTLLTSQPEIADEEIRAARELVAHDRRWASAVAAGTHVVYDAMPPIVTDARGRRLISVGIMTPPSADGTTAENEIVSVNLGSGEIVRYETGAPPAAVAPLVNCGAPSQSCGATAGDCGSVFHFEWPADDPVWKFDALHPACTSAVQGDGTGLELRNVKYHDRLVL